MDGRRMNIHLHIEELVLHGFAAGDRARIGDAVQRELADLFADAGVPPALANGGAVERLNAGAFEAGTPTRPETTGVRVARAVYGGLTTWARE